MATAKRQRVLILGAAGRDYHTFNTRFRNNGEAGEVVGFTHAQVRTHTPLLAAHCVRVVMAPAH